MPDVLLPRARRLITRPDEFRLNRESPQAQGLVGWWPLSDGAGYTARDRSSNGNHGTLESVMTPSDWVTEPVYGRCLDFDGNGDWVDIGDPNTLKLESGPISISLWIYDRSGANSCLTKGQSRANAELRAFDLFDTGSQFRWQGLSGGGAAWTCTTSTRPVLNTWHHICGTWDGTTGTNGVKLYVDGSLAAQATSSSASVNTGHDWYIGGNGANYPWDGRLFDVRIYSRVVSPSEVWSLYDPQSRWELYAPLLTRRYFLGGVAEGNEQTASLGVIASTTEQPSVTATYEAAVTASLSVAAVAVAQPSVTATHQAQYSASLAEAVAAVAQPAATATHQAQYSATLAVAAAAVAQPSVTATHESQLTASLAVAVAAVAQPAVTASSGSEAVASLAVSAAAVAQPSVTATYQSQLSASLAVSAAAVAQPAVTATTVVQPTAGLSVLVGAVSQPSVTGTFVAAQTATLAVVVASVTMDTVTATVDSPVTVEMQAGIGPAAVSGDRAGPGQVSGGRTGPASASGSRSGS